MSSNSCRIAVKQDGLVYGKSCTLYCMNGENTSKEINFDYA